MTATRNKAAHLRSSSLESNWRHNLFGYDTVDDDEEDDDDEGLADEEEDEGFKLAGVGDVDKGEEEEDEEEEEEGVREWGEESSTQKGRPLCVTLFTFV